MIGPVQQTPSRAQRRRASFALLGLIAVWLGGLVVTTLLFALVARALGLAG
jgi:hypothetical protein